MTGAARVVLIHGALCDAEIWTPQLDVLQRHGHDAVAVPLEGFYPDAFDERTFSADRHVAQIVNLLTACEGPSHLVGHSRGGRLALHVAAELPGRVASLMLVEPGGARDSEFLEPQPEHGAAPSASFEAAALAYLARGDHHGAVSTYVNAGHGRNAWARAPTLFRKTAIRNAVTLPGSLKDKSRPLSRATAERVRCPTALVTGRLSPPMFHQIADVLEATIPRSTRYMVKDADHFLPTARPQDFNDLLIRFLQVQSPQQSGIAPEPARSAPSSWRGLQPR